MYCKHCGKELKPQAKYCQSCGKPTIIHGKASEARISFVLGLVSLVSWVIPIFGWPIPIVGIVLGVQGLKSTKRNLAIAGLVLNSLTLLAPIISYSAIFTNNFFRI